MLERIGAAILLVVFAVWEASFILWEKLSAIGNRRE